MNKGLKIGLEILLAVIICLLAWLTVKSVQKPVKFNQELKARSDVAIQRLKDIRTLQVAFKSVNGRFSPSVDSLKMFYETGKMDIVMQIGSNDDSVAVANTEAIKKANKKLKPAEITAKLQEAYAAGTKVVFSTVTEIPVKDTLFRSRPDFCIDSLYYIPFSGKQLTQMESTIKTVSGVQVPLFEARMPYKALCKGMDNQLRINKDAECRDQNKYEGLQVGSVTAPNNNAGNWE
ncbi:MAG: hypothetical protein VZQ48_06385 [Candidatus Cryptobacteroides sp.]|jgi:hypothetical protein|nr:hypothetical protein [Candidatus Cryptobacteroides sp.]MEE3466348.1 hypothetical protein [Candidatus Cryptobacteroides sp.]